MIGQCIIHSNFSQIINIKNKKNKGLILQTMNKDASNVIIKNLIKFFNKKNDLGFSILKFFMIKLKGGGSQHLGGSFEMNKVPNELQTDILGRPKGFNNIHIVDATILPTLPAGTIVYNTIANCIRIAEEVSKKILNN